MQEEELVRGCQKFKPESQRVLYERYVEKMFGICLRYSNNREEAQDLMHEGFLKIFKDIRNYRHEGSLEGWMRKVMVNNALMYLRKTKKLKFESIENNETFSNISLNEETDDQVSKEMNLLKKADFTEEELLSAINMLSSGFKIVFNLYYIEQYAHKEIAAMLAINETTSRTRLARARKLIQKYLIDLGEEKIRIKNNITINQNIR